MEPQADPPVIRPDDLFNKASPYHGFDKHPIELLSLNPCSIIMYKVYSNPSLYEQPLNFSRVKKILGIVE
jgi:hypothetical protein